MLKKVRQTISAGSFAALLAAVLLQCVLVSALATPQTQSKSQPQLDQLIYSVKGPDLFRAHCAPCHGAHGKGDGPMVSVLKVKMPDLTLLAKNNGGQFPAATVRKTIGGGEVVLSHGSREMPIWGPIFHEVEDDKDFGNVRMENLVKYLESIQQK